MATLRSAVIRLASTTPSLRPHLLPLLKEAMEHATPEALKTYLKDHPGADKSNHSVKRPKKEDGTGEKSSPKKKVTRKDVTDSAKQVQKDFKDPKKRAEAAGAVEAAVSKMKPETKKSLAADIGHTGEKPAKSMKSFGDWADGHGIGGILGAAVIPAIAGVSYGLQGLAVGAATGPVGLAIGLGVLLAPVGAYGAAYLYGKMTGKNAPGFTTVEDKSRGNSFTYGPSIEDDTFKDVKVAQEEDKVDPKKLKELTDYMDKVKPKLQKALSSGKEVGDVLTGILADLPDGSAEVLAALGEDGPEIINEMLKSQK